jgi:hypothetical protein
MDLSEAAPAVHNVRHFRDDLDKEHKLLTQPGIAYPVEGRNELPRLVDCVRLIFCGRGGACEQPAEKLIDLFMLYFHKRLPTQHDATTKVV